jgi:peptidoglycan glycosyltransferase
VGRRIRWLGIVLILCFGLVIVQLTNIQFHRAAALATSKDNPINTVPPYTIDDRGSIFAADGETLAYSQRIAPKGSDTYQFQRVYPMGSLFSQIVGTCSPVYCNTGVEGYYSSQLGLHKQSAQTLSQLLSPPPPTTDDITLTIDPALQELATQELAGLPGPNRDGAIVMLNPKTGAILAFASNPSYDPDPLVSSDFKTEEAAEVLDTLKDSEGFAPIDPIASYNTIAPGSTAKVVTTAAIYNLDPSLATYNFPTTACLKNIPDTNQEICNDADTASAADACGGTIVQMLPASCDPGYAELGLLLGATDLSEQAALFGFDATPPLDLPSGYVQPSQYPTAQDMSADCSPSSPQCVGIPGQAYSAFGQQDVETTALQNALVAAGIANGGAVMTPHFLEKITNAQGQVVETYQPKVWKQAMTPQAAEQVVPLMQSVATSGTARGDGFPASLDVAVKTGTAQVGFPTITSVSDWMIGFAPANNPEVAIAVAVPYQPLTTQGASVAGPVVRTMLEKALG